MGWYCYLKDTIDFPFSAVCCERRSNSPLKIQEKVVVVGMALEEKCEKEMLVSIRWLNNDGLVVPLRFILSL